MPQIAYIDGRYQPISEPAIMVDDRGYQFGDGVYEVCAVRGGCVCEFDAHFARLTRSCAALAIELPMSAAVLAHIIGETIRRNRIKEGIIYLQLTRGVAAREHIYPPNLEPVLVVTARPTDARKRMRVHARGLRIITRPDDRWARVDIKSIGLLPNVLARQAAFDARAHEAWLVDAQGFITEGAATTAWIVDADNMLRTRALEHGSQFILPGIARQTLLELLNAENIAHSAEPFTVAEAKAAREAFSTASTMHVMPIIEIDGVKLGDGTPGVFTRRLIAYYEDYLTNSVQ